MGFFFFLCNSCQDENQKAADRSAVISLFFKAIGHLPRDFLKEQIRGAQ